MNTAITIDTILTVLGVIVALVAGAGAINKIISVINSEHDRMQKYEDYGNQITALNNKIESTHAESEAKMQQIMAEQYILTKSMLAVLDGLKQQGCNGAVTKAKDELERYLNQQAHGGA